MQIRATVKWRQSLPLTQKPPSSPPLLTPFTSFPPLITGPGCFSFSYQNKLSTPPFATDFHTPKLGSEAFPLHKLGRVAVNAMRLRYSVYIRHFHWKIQDTTLRYNLSIPHPLEFQFHCGRMGRVIDTQCLFHTRAR